MPILVADALAGETFKAKGKSPNVTALSVEVDKAFEGDSESQRMLVRRANDGLDIDHQLQMCRYKMAVVGSGLAQCGICPCDPESDGDLAHC